MEWFNDLLWKDSPAHTIIIYSIIIAVGVFIGKKKFFGASLGITFVLFAGLALGHFGFTANQKILEFVRDFGLILFIFSIGLQVGPGFFSSFKKGGLSLNLMALLIVITGSLITVSLHYITDTSMPVLVGVMSGAVTNTPGLGAAQNALDQLSDRLPVNNIPEIGLGYAVAYPFGVIGIILTMVVIKKLFRIDLNNELKLFNEYQHPSEIIPEKASIIVTNPEMFNKSVLEISKNLSPGIVISRILHKGDLSAVTSDTILHKNDIILVVAQKSLMEEVVGKFGSISNMDLSSGSGNLISRRVIVTNSNVFGKDLGSLRLRSLYNINITRIYRSGIEFMATPKLRLQMGDRLTVVGDEKSVEKVSDQLGNSLKRLKEPNLVPIFFGILIGVILGSIPVYLPGIAHPLKLGLAGGPLIVAILISKYGHRFSLASYTTTSANLMLREIGIVLFLASVGLSAGQKFIPALTSGEGFKWMGYGAAITFLPLIITGSFARMVLKRNYFEICGLLSGSMTDPPALAFANSIAQSESPAIAYAAVYPLTMFLRIFVAQLLILIV